MKTQYHYLVLLLEKNIINNNIEDSENYICEASEYFENIKDDIDLPRYFIALGRYWFLKGDFEKSFEFLRKASNIAQKSGLIPEQWQASCYISEIAFDQKDFETSFKYAQSTLNSLKKITDKLTNQEHLQKYYSDQRIIQLLGRIKSLKAVLNKKRGAAE